MRVDQAGLLNERANLPLSEQFGRLFKEWADLDAAARLLEEMKTTTLEQRKNQLGDMPDSHAERKVKADPEWAEYIQEMVRARTEANLAKGRLEFLRIKIREWEQQQNNARMEAKL